MGQLPSPFPLTQAVRERGSSVTGAYEGWFKDRDGSIRLLVGYFNRNTKQELDIPVGPDNRIEPGGPDQGQPTHFLAGRQWGVFTIKVPADFGTKKLTWTIVANGQTNTITMHLKPDWVIEPFEDAASKNTPPVVRFERGGATFTGPPVDIAASYTANAATPIELAVWVTDEGPKVNVPEPTPSRRSSGEQTAPPPPITMAWSAYRGPANVVFDPPKPKIDRESGFATTKATFTEPGDYLLRAQVNDRSGDGGGGFQCCWTNAHVKVSVK